MAMCGIELEQDVFTVKVEFSGGLEMLFSNVKEHQIDLPTLLEDGKTPTVNYLVKYLCERVMRDRRKELFVQDDTVRPGILVLINDADWELEGEGGYTLRPNDNVVFVSTLHGG